VKILKVAVQYALTDRYREDAIIRAWLRQKVITNTLVLTAQDVLSTLEFSDSDEILFVKAFEPALNGGNFMIKKSSSFLKLNHLLQHMKVLTYY
jgi:hypothetical protein